MAANIRVDGPVATLTLCRPAVYNALNRECLVAIGEFARCVARDERVRLGVVTGEGEYFCAGADIPEFLASVSTSGDASAKHDFLDVVYASFEALRKVEKPLIASVNGPALAGGLELVLSCDLVVSAMTARFGDAHANYGIIPGGGGSALLPRVVPPNVAKYLLLSGETLSAQEMQGHGLVNIVVESSRLAATTDSLAASLAAKSPLALRAMKRLANEALDRSLDDAAADEFIALRNHAMTEDLREGLNAFVEKRLPVFTGR